MRFFAEYICARPELIKLALAERESNLSLHVQCHEPAERAGKQLQNRRVQDVRQDTRQTMLNLFFKASNALPCVIKNAEGKIAGKPTYARICVRRKP